MKARTDHPAAAELAGYEVLVGVAGGIAAYKVCEVVSTLVQQGAGVTVAMTRAARKFVGPTTFQALSGRTVLTSVWRDSEAQDVRHITVSGAADLTLIAPATADIIGKLAAGIADDIVTTLVIAGSSPVLLAPAMNDRMWSNPLVQRNVKTLTDLGYQMIGPGEGWLACRSLGAGRMADAAEIVKRAAVMLRASPPKRISKSK